jgi:hypothetical protein
VIFGLYELKYADTIYGFFENIYETMYAYILSAFSKPE